MTKRAKNLEDLSGDTPEARAKRVLALRKKVLDCSREEMEQRLGIPASTIQNWEGPLNQGLGEKGAKRLIAALQHASISCSLEWLLYGSGSPPPGLSLMPSFPLPSGSSLEDAFIAQELQIFHQNHPHAMDMIVPDDAMSPILEKGDIVAGIRYFEQDIAKAIGRVAIVQLINGETLVRRVEVSTTTGFYHLSCANINTTAERPAPSNVKLFSAAPIQWIRKK